VQPYSGSAFLPGKIAKKKTVNFPLSLGCTTNLLSHQLKALTNHTYKIECSEQVPI